MNNIQYYEYYLQSRNGENKCLIQKESADLEIEKKEDD